MKKATSQDVARLAGVSQATVSLILNNSDKITFSSETKEKVFAAAQELGYELPRRKKQPSRKSSRMLLVLTPTLTNPYYSELIQAVEDYLGDDLSMAKSFKVESKRADKRFPMTSIQLSQEIGGRIAEAFPQVAVDVHNPDYTVYVEVREQAAYVHGPAEPGAGGLPTGMGGRAAVLLSGGIDSPVAGYMIAKRGVEIESIHFFSYPYTSEQAKEKVLELARLMTRYSGRMTVNVVGFTKVQEVIRDQCPEEYFTIIMRRFMMRIAERIARQDGCKCLVTGENLGQVASQTMEAMAVTGAVVDMPLFHPLIGMDKKDIIAIAQKIGTLETSILPYEDCCTVFTPRHPKTKPSLREVEAIEAKMDVEGLVAHAIENTEKVTVRYHGGNS